MTAVDEAQSLTRMLVTVRDQVAAAFGPETAAPGFVGPVPSCGQCAVTAIVLRELIGGELLRTQVAGDEHWLNRVSLQHGTYDIDLTGDQFGLPAIQLAPAGQLYAMEKIAADREITAETINRAICLANRAQLSEIVPRLQNRFSDQIAG